MVHRKRGPISLQRFALGDMLRCGVGIRGAAAEAGSMEEAAGSVVGFLHRTLRSADGERPGCALIRCFVTLPLGELDDELRERAVAQGDTPLTDETRCLVLLATAGDEPAWNDRRASREHAVIPLPSPEVVERAPMIARMIQQMGVEAGALVGTPGKAAPERTYDVFFVPEAEGSPFIPAQESFVRAAGVRSVLGFGGALQEEHFFFLLFSRDAVPESTASRFRTIAIDARLALLKHERQVVFAEAGG